MTTPPTILYVDYNPASGIERRRLDGLCRYAATRKWRVETLEHRVCTPVALREARAHLRPIGCAAECWCPETALRPALFGRVPVVYFNTPDRSGWRNARRVECDEAAVARLAFEELSSTNPPAYAAVSFWEKERWARERIGAFRECCRKAGADCRVWHFPAIKNDDEFRARAAQMIPWAAALPHRCAVFAVNDWCAHCAARAMSRAGRSFPRTVTLVGADGTESLPLDRELAATVSSVRLDFEHAGYLAAKMIASAVPPGTIETFPPLLVDRRKSTRGYGRREPRILEAIEMIRREACDGLTAKELASRFRGTRQLFDLRFREAMGHPPLDEIIHIRMERVLELLAQPDFPISAIADFCGFSSERVLRKLFRSRFKTSMLNWRRARR